MNMIGCEVNLLIDVYKRQKKNSVQVNTVEHVVEVVKNSTDVGNGTWGKICLLYTSITMTPRLSKCILNTPVRQMLQPHTTT